MGKEADGLIVFWNDKWFQVYYNSKNEISIAEIGADVASLYRKKKRTSKVYNVAIPIYQNGVDVDDRSLS